MALWTARAVDAHKPCAQAYKLMLHPKDALLDRTIFVVSPSTYTKFLAMLDRAPKPNERLQRTMKAQPPWPKGRRLTR